MTLPGHEDWVRGVHLTMDGELHCVCLSVCLHASVSLSVPVCFLIDKGHEFSGHGQL